MTSEKIYPLASTTWDGLEIDAMQRVIVSGKFTMGREVSEYEKRFAEHFGAKYAVMSNSGSSANLLAVAAMRYSSRFSNPEKNEVIVPAVSWSTTYYPIVQLGYKIKFVDIDLDSLNMSIDQTLSAIDEKTAGIFAVNLLGNPAELPALRKKCDELGIFLLEDNCESMGASIEGKMAGSYGEVGTFSSFFSHHISTMEGGMCITDDLELAQVMTSMRAHGWTRELPQENFVHNKTGDEFDDLFRFILPGYNLRPLELSGAIGIEQIKKLNDFVSVRRDNALYFQEAFSGIPNVRTQAENGLSSWFGFSMVLEGPIAGRRAELVKVLNDLGIDSRPIVAGNFTKNPVLKHLDHVEIGELPNADKIHVDGLFVGNHHYDLEIPIKKLAEVVANL
jgi:CDP-6-deoxy-D-xylo-4-hexulose-3-dehydrase